MRKSQTLWLMGLLVVFPLCPTLQAQTAPPPGGHSQVRESLFSHVNHLAPLSRSGNSAAAVALADQLFLNIGVKPDIADAFSFTNRIAQAEMGYRRGQHSAIHESDVVRAVNNMATAIGAPQWAHTNQTEVRRLRMHMLVLYPRLMASSDPPDGKGHYKALSNDLSPMEASYLAATMLYQKLTNPKYQFSDTEKVANAKLSAATVRSVERGREKALHDILSGKTQTVSARDLLTYADQFFSDLGIQPGTSASIQTSSQSERQQGGQL